MRTKVLEGTREGGEKGGEEVAEDMLSGYREVINLEEL